MEQRQLVPPPPRDAPLNPAELDRRLVALLELLLNPEQVVLPLDLQVCPDPQPETEDG